MSIPLSVRIRSFFARNKYAFWWDHFTDEEKQLRRMDVWELAKVINEARVRNLAGEAEKLIVAEHMLNVRLAQIQAKASWGSGVLGFVGAIIGSALSVALTIALQSPQSPKEAPSAPERASEKHVVAPPVQSAGKPVPQSLKNEPSNKIVEVSLGTKSVVNGLCDGTKAKQANAPVNP
ncbi:hypothetical protein MGMO_54c00010 [Methyloglobulus morosus KoM1]|uniref:Uncharacterized protein n=1 Tax=Methyloglobulus morosus KoM1 TaxID=1116472 RepID=V5C204_9GAMM|nr:hypothetical protein [Methyloglobulus morosus]ESS72512.1 hypothetical protein MGMO_54c00010 [Methyloglobulus morosus KoM1]